VSLGEDEKDVEQLRKDVYSFAASWIEEEGASTYVGGANNRVVRIAVLSTFIRISSLTPRIERDASHLRPHGDLHQEYNEPLLRSSEISQSSR
jgi:hypothetical protein